MNLLSERLGRAESARASLPSEAAREHLGNTDLLREAIQNWKTGTPGSIRQAKLDQLAYVDSLGKISATSPDDNAIPSLNERQSIILPSPRSASGRKFFSGA